MDVGQELALSFGVSRVHKGLWLVDIDTIHVSSLPRGRLVFSPHPCEGGLDLLLEAGDQFAVGGNEPLLAFDLGDDGLLRSEGWEGELDLLERVAIELRLAAATHQHSRLIPIQIALCKHPVVAGMDAILGKAICIGIKREC